MSFLVIALIPNLDIMHAQTMSEEYDTWFVRVIYLQKFVLNFKRVGLPTTVLKLKFLNYTSASLKFGILYTI